MIAVSKNASSRPIKWKLLSALYQRRKPKDEYSVDIPEDLAIYLEQLRRFSLHELRVATEDFSQKNRFRPEDHSDVYRGWLADGFPVVVKRYNPHNRQAAEVKFRREVEINSIAAHPSVLNMLGFCITPKEWLLVYPLMVNGSVASWLRGRHESQPPLNWPIRKGIALGVARGLAYLHYECGDRIIHRDINSENIWLDEDYEAVVADFALGIIMDHRDTKFEDVVQGKIGHIAPEYLSTGEGSEKIDVFSYGVFLLELFTGQRSFDFARLANGEDVMLLEWVKTNYKERKWEIMVDADCRSNYMEDVVKQMVKVALLCTHYTPGRRPKMSEVVRMLEDEDVLADRWEEWYKKEVERENDSSKSYPNSDWIMDDNTSNLSSEEENDSSKSHPNSDWIMDDNTSNLSSEELSSPR